MENPGPVEPFVWRDGERIIHFGRGLFAGAHSLVGPGPYSAITTARARASAPMLMEGAHSVHVVGPGRVDELAAELRPRVSASTLVALGGGRVIDVAKALAAADPPRAVVAIPTTLSGAEMTAIHRHAATTPDSAPTVRPAVVILDPAVAASQPEAPMLASAMNALGHCAEAPLTVHANPMVTMAAERGADHIEVGATTLDRDHLAMGALLGGYAIGLSGYGVHHVVSQTLVRYQGIEHATANALMLPHTAEWLARRHPAREAELARIAALARATARRAGLSGLTELRVASTALPDLAARASARPELDMVPPRPTADDIEALFRAAL